MTKLQFSQSSLSDLKRLREFVAKDNFKAAQRISLRIRQAVEKLVNFPAMGHPVEGLEEVREFIAGNYVIRYVYFNDEDKVVILRIWHGREYRD